MYRYGMLYCMHAAPAPALTRRRCRGGRRGRTGLTKVGGWRVFGMLRAVRAISYIPQLLVCCSIAATPCAHGASSFAAIGSAINFSASSATIERFITRATKHSNSRPFFHQGSGSSANNTPTTQPWEQHVTPFPAVIHDTKWAAPLGPFRLYYAVQTDCGFVNGESKFESCRPSSCAVALATSVDGINWIKPALGLCTFSGNLSGWNDVNNLVLCPGSASGSVNALIWHDGFDCNGVSIMKDENPAAPDSERYKLFGAFGAPLDKKDVEVGGTPTYIASSDGIHFPNATRNLVSLPLPEAFKNGTIRFDCLPDFRWDTNRKHYIGIARGRRPGDQLGYPHTWYPQCASSKSKIPPAVCDKNFRTFAFMTSPDLKHWTVRAPPQPASKEHQTYTTAAFRFHDLTLATVSVFEETTAPNDFGFVRCSIYYTTNPEISAGPWESIGMTPGGDDLIPLGEHSGDFDYGLCYASPPVIVSGGR
eukprot:COSAG02_NODE_2982_length_7621_cov_3.542808_9_plen_477_part_01